MGSPFGIRKRLKSMLGLGPKGPPPQPTPRFTLVLSNGADREETVEADVDQSLLLVSGNVATPLASGCSDSTCSTCRVEVLEGAEFLNAQSEQERTTLRANGREETLRLACATLAERSGTVRARGFEFLE